MPEVVEGLARSFGAAARQPGDENGTAERPSASAGDPGEIEATFFEQLVERAPGKGAMAAAALGCKLDRGGCTLH